MKELDFSTIGSRLRETRTSKGLTQEYLADYADVNVSHISNIENNRVKISLTLLVSLCNALDTTVDYILASEYIQPESSIEKELALAVHDLPYEKQETLLKIARVL
ncbi:MAG: helix-turn-helix domain-containing protein [Ruminococcus flavefaciens]|nr:helix-turn-helix domain-containing protein [Ruminococcus flavefaciens]